MTNITDALSHISRNMDEWNHRAPIPFEEFLRLVSVRPNRAVRNIFQLFHDMVKEYVVEGYDEYRNDPEAVHYVPYDCRRLFVEGSDRPFFADRLFANRLVNLVEALKRGAQQNKIYVFEGPPGSGKSTFLNNLLMRIEQYANTEEGALYETVWRLNPKVFGQQQVQETNNFIDRISRFADNCPQLKGEIAKVQSSVSLSEEYIEVPCPSHDHPLLMIPKQFRQGFVDDLFGEDDERRLMFDEKEYEWLFRSSACTICSSLYQALMDRLNDPAEVFRMIHVRRYQFNRRLGVGISVITPGDKPMKQTVLTNEILQNRMNDLLKDSNLVRYIFSRFAKTNNGVYVLMDIKSHNIERFIELHNIISEGLHKVEDIEENVNSLFLALMNPEDKPHIHGFQSFSDRIESIKIPFVLDLNTEVEIYRNVFGRQLDGSFLPRVLHNFARVIISTRMKLQSAAMEEWISAPTKYSLFCDDNLQLLKMELYTGYIPRWLMETDRKKLTAKLRRKILDESENEGWQGFSGRDSIKIFNEFYSLFARKDKLINMSDLCNFFTKVRRDLNESIPDGFLDSVRRMYNYTVLQEVKESLYYYNEAQISREIQNYLFAINFEPGVVETCGYTGDRLDISDEFLAGIETRLLGTGILDERRAAFRKETQKEYASATLTREIMVEGKKIIDTRLYGELRERYVHNIKEKVLDPFLENENFRRAIKDFGRESFKTYDRRIRDDVIFLINNLCKKYRYTRHGARDVCIYVIDNELAKQFGSS